MARNFSRSETEFSNMDMSTAYASENNFFFNRKFQFRYAKLLDLEYPREKT